MDSILTAALALSAVFTLTISLISITRTAKVPLRHILSLSFVLYLFLFLLGNGIATLIAAGALTDDKRQLVTLQGPTGATTVATNQPATNNPSTTVTEKTADSGVPKRGLGARLPGPVWIWAAFLGVFGFQGILTRINVTLFGKGVLTIEDWIAKAEEAAVARANEIYTDARFVEAQKTAGQLATLPEADLNAYVTTHLGIAVIAELEKAAKDAKANVALLKAQALASQKPNEAKAIAKQMTLP